MAWELSQEPKHQLLNGEIIAFSGGLIDHNDSSLNVCKLLDDRVTPPCKAHNSDTIIETRASKGEKALRADASVSCSSEDVGRARYIRHPRIVVKVRSPRIGGGPVRSYTRDEHWEWQQEPTIAGEGVLVFRAAVEVTLDEIYRRTSLDNAPAPYVRRCSFIITAAR